MSRVKEISINRTFNLGNYESAKIGLTIEVEVGEDPSKILQYAVDWVETRKLFFDEDYLKALEVIKTPDDYTPKQLKRALDMIKEVESCFEKPW